MKKSRITRYIENALRAHQSGSAGQSKTLRIATLSVQLHRGRAVTHALYCVARTAAHRNRYGRVTSRVIIAAKLARADSANSQRSPRCTRGRRTSHVTLSAVITPPGKRSRRPVCFIVNNSRDKPYLAIYGLCPEVLRAFSIDRRYVIS